MATPSDNGFTADTFAVRRARLQAIQSNRAVTQPLLPNLHASVVAWMNNCATEYEALVGSANVQDSASISHTESLHLTAAALNTQLDLAKEYILSHYSNDSVRRSALGVEVTIPTTPDEMIPLAQKILSVTAEHKTEGIDYCMSDARIARLSDALAALVAAQQERNTGESNTDKSHTAEGVRYDNDVTMLRRLLSEWHAELGFEDPRIGLIGMVNTQKGGNPGKPGAPSIVIDPQDLALVITPDANRPTPTSYQTEFREVGTEEPWEEFANSSENRVPTAVALLNAGTDYEFRTRARNSNGYGEWSGIVVRVG